ncbi:MAG: DsbA family oxidoreductase [Egibacteraceae bacterium]
MAEPIRFHFDPICPWCYQTSRWVRRLAELHVVDVDWGVFSLELVNAGTELSERKGHQRSEAALRTAVTVRADQGNAALGRFYAALGATVHEQGADLESPDTITAALEAAGLDAVLLEKALGDESTWDAVTAEHTALIERTRSFGVPTIVLDGGDGPAIFGPVVTEPPTDDDAVELWRHVAWLTRYENFSELKRDRSASPDLESVRRLAAQQAAQR